jgi:glycosyltransferase A (GT-A) superfamily protein (DUF2064 family)
MRRTIVVLAKAPDESTGAMRSVMDAQAASCLHECFLLDTLEKALAVPDADLAVCSATGDDLAFLQHVTPRWTTYVHGEGMCLGERINSCLEQVRNPGTAAIVIRADTPTLPARCLELAFDALAADGVDLVLGPSISGGWYLVGMSAAHPELLEGADWGDPQSIIDRAAELGLGWFMLPAWRCIRTADDLEVLRGEAEETSSLCYSAPRTREFLCELGEKQGVPG